MFTQFRKIITILLLITVQLNLCPTTIQAQREEATLKELRQEATLQTEKLDNQLNLTPEQKSKIYEINLKYAKKRRISNKRKDALQRVKNKNNEISKLLTPTQQKIFWANKRKVKPIILNGKKENMRTQQNKKRQS